MSIRDSIRIALVNFRKHKVRTFLSVLGVVIGILSVSLIVSLGQGVKGFVVSQVTQFGSNIIDITSKVPGKGAMGTVTSGVQGVEVTSLKESDFEAIESFDFVVDQASFTMGQVWTQYRNEENQAYLMAVSPAYINIDQQAKLKKGRFFTESENEGANRVVVLGLEAKEKLFGNREAIGKSVKLKNYNFKVIGIMAERGQVAGFNYDDVVWAPLKTGQQSILGVDYVREGIVKIKAGEDMDLAKSRIESMLRRRHNISDPDKDDFLVMSIEEALEIANNVTQALNILLIFLASISLLVGGVGIMNIMLVSLSERIREVGLRKALGATDRDLLLQFLTESTLLTAFGGLIGIVLALLLTVVGSVVVRQFGIAWRISFPIVGFSVAFLVSVAVGILFGVYPARKAAKLDPIKAIREE